MTSTGPRDAYGRPLTRAEIDVLVRESMRLETDLDKAGPGGIEELLDRTPYRVVPMKAPRTRRTSRRGPWAVFVLVTAIISVLVLHRGSPAATATVPTHPTTYADGSYAFMKMQAQAPAEPVGYNPCLRIPVVINYANATSDIQPRVADAIAEINRVSGLHLTYAGATGLRRGDAGGTGTIVVSFADGQSDRALDSPGILAVGGSSSYVDALPGVRQYYVGGQVTLNVSSFNGYRADLQHAILLHELGHALGMDHVTDTTEIMNPAINAAVTHYQHGDLTALAKLGQVPCR